MQYDAVIIGGSGVNRLGRTLGIYRLRSAAEQRGYNVKVIDWAFTLTFEQMMELMNVFINEKTLVLGISYAWILGQLPGNNWITKEFFVKLKEKYPNLQIVTGGQRKPMTPKTTIISPFNSWFLKGFSDYSFVELLDFLSGKKSSPPKHFKDKFNTRIVESNIHYPTKVANDLETFFKEEDEFLPHQPIPIEISRGCIFKCSFCSHPFLGKKDYEYIRTPDNIAAEFKRNYELFGTTRYIITDDTFNDSMEKLDRVKKAIDLSGIPKFEFVSYIKPELLVTKPEMIPALKEIGLRGAHFGIESLNLQARQAVGKGMDVERIFDATHKLTENNVDCAASLILGLPGDKYEDFYKWQEFFVENQQQLFKSWHFFVLGIAKIVDNDIYSVIEHNPQKFGYTVSPMKNKLTIYQHWVHECGTDVDTCTDVYNILSIEAVKAAYSGGWDIAGDWYLNLPDELTKNKKQIEYKPWRIAKRNAMNRALTNYKKYTNINKGNINE